MMNNLFFLYKAFFENKIQLSSELYYFIDTCSLNRMCLAALSTFSTGENFCTEVGCNQSLNCSKLRNIRTFQVPIRRSAGRNL